MKRRAPPRLALLMLETLLPSESRDAVVGDLVEAHELRAAGNRLTAALHFWREAAAAVLQLQAAPELVSAFTPCTRESRVQSLLSDTRHALRLLARARGFTVLCVATLGIAIGATASIYSIVSPVLLRSLPFPNADRLLRIDEKELDGSASRIGYETYLDLRNSARTLQASALSGFWQPTIFGDRDAERVRGQVVTWEYFRTLGVHPRLGRDFTSADDTPDTRNVVILSHALWLRRFGGDPQIVGKTINTGGTTRRIVGVMPASFEDVVEPTAEIWRPLGYAVSGSSSCRTCRHLQMIARMRGGVTQAQAAGEMDALHRRIAAENPRSYGSVGMFAVGLQDRITENARPILLALFGAVGLVLLIATANVANLQLARAVRRHEEFAVRAALGAGRGRIARQLLAEGVALAFLGALAGVGVAVFALPALVSHLPPDLPRLSAIRLDWQALSLVLCVALLVGAAVGLAPALGAGRARLFDALRGGGRSVAGQRHRLRAALVIAEVALALMLVVGAGLLGHSLLRLLSVNPGFDVSRLVTMEVQAIGPAYQTSASVFANHDRLRAAVRAVPGVEDVGLATQLPLGGNFDRYGIAARDKPLDNPELAPSADRYTVSADFIRAMRIPILRGRGFTEAEAADSNVQIAIVSDALAKRIWPGEDAIGRYIRMGGPTRPWKQVVGIVGNVRHTGLDATETLQVYVPERQWYYEENSMVLVVRTRGEPASTIPAVVEAARGVDPLQPIAKVATMENVVATSTSQRRLGLLLFVAFGVIALLLASAGIYGVLAGSVAERTREFGLRTAMGATPAAIVSLVLRQAGGLALAGLVLGGIGAIALSRYLRALLFGVAPTDPVAVAFATLVITVVALVACLVPARRAVRVDPMTALRTE
ncbi:MAG TPA: ABC transporter permease [Gemmatimonadaceae bacterium]|nr:ABC transporter permease [Gemmatimonadaceae bacterium]